MSVSGRRLGSLLAAVGGRNRRLITLGGRIRELRTGLRGTRNGGTPTMGGRPTTGGTATGGPITGGTTSGGRRWRGCGVGSLEVRHYTFKGLILELWRTRQYFSVWGFTTLGVLFAFTGLECRGA